MPERKTVQAFVKLVAANGHPLVDPDLRPKLVAAAAEKGVSLSNLVVEILSERYGVPFEPTTRKTSPAPEGEEINFACPAALHRKIRQRTQHPYTVNDSIRVTLSAHYGLPVPPKPPRRART